jgi:hypothetical protein
LKNQMPPIFPGLIHQTINAKNQRHPTANRTGHLWRQTQRADRLEVRFCGRRNSA